MSLCPVCGRVYCDHTEEERGQTVKEMMRDLTPEEKEAVQKYPPDAPEKIEATRRAHLQFIWGKVRISPSVWPNRELKVQPGDLSRFVPYGNGVYGYQERSVVNPFTSAPIEDDHGGTIYFGPNVTREDFEALMRILGITARERKRSRDYALFYQEAEKPGREGYIAQVRIVDKFALRYVFEAIGDVEYDSFFAQDLDVVDALWAFMQKEKERWGTAFWDDGKGLRGMFGGDGDYAREALCFGFMIENGDDVFRLWSRAELVTK
ncbi:MAG: hypothetical protein Q7S03_03175 [bacterium]|nr:hypothetical protein [bacterium]